MKGKGAIILRTRITRQVTLMKKRHRLAIAVQIIDNGPGIPVHLRDKIFYPLVSGRADGHGLGTHAGTGFREPASGQYRIRKRTGTHMFHRHAPT